MMKKISILVAIVCCATLSFGQRLEMGEMQVNAGLGFNSGSWSVPIYVGAEYGIYPDVSVGGTLNLALSNGVGTWVGIGARGDYHFNTLLDIIDEFDVYAGATLSCNMYSYSGKWKDKHDDYNSLRLDLGLQIGGRYYFTDQWAVNLEIGGGFVASGGKIGVTYKF